jgi:hypothetical protein
VYSPNKQDKELEGDRERKRSVEVDVVTSVVHELGSCFGNGAVGVFVLEATTSRVKENLLGCHVVTVENWGKYAGLDVDTLLFPDLLVISEVRGGIVEVRAGRAANAAAIAARSARGYGRAAMFVAASGAAVIADLFGVVTGDRESAGHGVPITREPEADFVNFFERCIAFVHVGNKVAVSLYFTWRSDEDMWSPMRVIRPYMSETDITGMLSSCETDSFTTAMYAVKAAAESSLRVMHFSKPHTRNLCVMTASARGQRVKIRSQLSLTHRGEVL